VLVPDAPYLTELPSSLAHYVITLSSPPSVMEPCPAPTTTSHRRSLGLNPADGDSHSSSSCSAGQLSNPAEADHNTSGLGRKWKERSDVSSSAASNLDTHQPKRFKVESTAHHTGPGKQSTNRIDTFWGSSGLCVCDNCTTPALSREEHDTCVQVQVPCFFFSALRVPAGQNNDVKFLGQGLA
jgi:hypothetical protein